MNIEPNDQTNGPKDPVTHPDVPHNPTPTEPEGAPDPPVEPDPYPVVDPPLEPDTEPVTDPEPGKTFPEPLPGVPPDVLY